MIVGGGDTSKVQLELAACDVKQIFLNMYSYAVLCRNGKVIAWGDESSTPHCQFIHEWPFMPVYAIVAGMENKADQMKKIGACQW